MVTRMFGATSGLRSNPQLLIGCWDPDSTDLGNLA